MKNKPQKKMRGPTLQEIELVPMTDPAELEAIDSRRKASEKAMRTAQKGDDAVLRKAGKRKSRTRKET